MQSKHTNTGLLGVVVICLVVAVVSTRPTSPDEVTSLPGIGTPNTRTLSGLLLANKTYGAYLYYFFMESQSDPKNDPVVLWLQGGPGSTSMFGCFTELGPYIIAANGTFSKNMYSWNAKANVLWIDQPVGTGYSYAQNNNGYAKTEEVVSSDLYNALVQFMQIHPEYSHQPFYAFGESYAGKYVPWLAATILKYNPKQINLKGIGLGDGWVDPQRQALSYGPFLYQHDRITQQQLVEFNATYQQYLKLVENKQWKKASDFDNDMLDNISNASKPPVINQFDIRYDTDITDPSYYAMLKYMARDDVKNALHVPGRKFSEGGKAYRKLTKDEEQSCLFLFPTILRNTSVLLYNGEYDLICDWIGTAYYAANINWPGQEEFNKKTDVAWNVDGSPAGHYKAAANLVKLIVYNAGHMSPFDQPKNTQDMLYRFIAGGFV